MRNLKTITKKEIELHAAKVHKYQILLKILSEDGETTIKAIQKLIKIRKS